MATRNDATYERRTGWGFWLGRCLLAAMAVGSIAWGAACLPIFLNQIRLDATKDLILRNVALSDNELKGLLPLLDRAAAREGCIPAIDRSSAIIRLHMLDNSLTPESQALVDDRMDGLDVALRKSLSCAPADPYLWLALFWLRNTRDGFSTPNLDLLRMSYLVGPNEGWVVLKRSHIALAMFDGLPRDLADEAIAEFARLVKSELYTEAMEILSGPGWPHRDRLMAALASVPPRNVVILVKAMADTGYDLDALSAAERRNRERP